jgi:hypothetical protein
MVRLKKLGVFSLAKTLGVFLGMVYSFGGVEIDFEK